MSTRKAYKGKRTKKSAIGARFIAILKRDKIIEGLVFSEQFENLVSERPGFIQHLKSFFIIGKSNSFKVRFMIFGISSELENLGFFGFENIFSFEVGLENGIQSLNLVA